MSESVKSINSSIKSSKSSKSSKSKSTTNEARKLSGIVHKMESLISRIHNDKLNNTIICQTNNNNKEQNKHTNSNPSDATTDNQTENNNTNNNNRSASLDSLNNLTDPDSFGDNEIMHSDSDAEIAHITGKTSVQVHQHHFNQHQHQLHQQYPQMHQSHQNYRTHKRRGSDLDELNDLSIKNCAKGGTFDFDSAWSAVDEDEEHDHHDQDNGLMMIDNHNDADNSLCKSNNFKCDKSQSLSSSSSSSTISKTGRTDSNNNFNDINFMNDSESPPNEKCDVKNGNGSISSGCSSVTSTSSTKNRRTSITSSGSVGRMETILEEPIEAKISVKEILARFETMSTTEAQSKSSSISSGARAAAQTLNVPIERLESRQSNHRESSQSRDVVETHHRNSRQDVIDSQIVNHNSYQQQLQHQQQQQQQFQTHHQNHQMNEESGNTHNNHNSNARMLNEGQLVLENHSEQVERHHFIKQQSYLHSRKTSASQLQQQHQQQQHQSAMDANYITEESHPETPPSVTKYSLLQFAMQHFRNDHTVDHRSNEREDHRASTNRSYAELVKWQGVPIRAPLLRLPTDLAPLALECFDCILRYCGDVPLDPELTEVKCVYTVLMHCHKYLALRDEVYCQLMKQTTANRSPCPDSSQRAWRLLSILAAYFGCSDALRPYLMEHLTSAASDRRRSCHGTAAVCLTNLRKTARCGGRKNVPSVEEVTAVSAGRSARRQIYRLPGGAERVVNTRCSTVVADVISELCALLGVDSEAEQQEFSLYCIVQGDAFTMPLAADEYILDVTTELLKSGQPFYLIFCRSVWHFSLKRDPAPTALYIEVLFNQVAPDYLEGLLLELPGNGVPMPEVVRDMARIAALLHRAADLNHVPAMKEIKFLLPKPALGIREIRPAQWVSLVQSAWPAVANLSPGQVKAQFLNVLSAWSLFGSSFFAVKRIWTEDGPHVEESSPMWRDLILALNRSGVLFLDPNTHETLQHWPFMEVISTRKVRSEDGALFLDMKVGNLMQQRVIRVQTEQAHEISRLVRQYITMAQISQREKLN